MASSSYRIGIARVLACSLLWPGCQSRLHMNEAANAAATAKMMVDASTQTPESSLSLPSAHTGKRAASKLSQPDTEEKKESSVAVARSQPLTTDTCVFPQAVAHAAVAQESQEFGITDAQEFGITDAIASSRDLAATTLATTPHQDTKPTAQAAQKEEDPEASQAIPAGLKSWFQRFANAVDDVNEDVEDADSLAWLSELIKEGRAAGYLTQSVPIAINTVGWEPNCTPLHYAAAKGNAQAVAALLRESSVVIDAKTEDQYGSTPLHFAAYEGNLGAAQLLVEGYKQRNKLSEIDAHDKEGASPLQYAAGGPWGGPNRDVAELLVANGADPKQCLGKNKNITLVDLSAMGGNFAMVEYWIEEIAYTGLFPEEEEKKLIESAMKLARRQKHSGIVTLLQRYYEDL
jgi:Ankyrin repeats (3 copies)